MKILFFLSCIVILCSQKQSSDFFPDQSIGFGTGSGHWNPHTNGAFFLFGYEREVYKNINPFISLGLSERLLKQNSASFAIGAHFYFENKSAWSRGRGIITFAHFSDKNPAPVNAVSLGLGYRVIPIDYINLGIEFNIYGVLFSNDNENDERKDAFFNIFKDVYFDFGLRYKF